MVNLDIEAEVRALQEKRANLTEENEVEEVNKAKLAGGVAYDTDIYGMKEYAYGGYVTSIATTDDLEVRLRQSL